MWSIDALNVQQRFFLQLLIDTKGLKLQASLSTAIEFHNDNKTMSNHIALAKVDSPLLYTKVLLHHLLL